MLNPLDEAIQEMKQFTEECDRAQEELKKERNPKLKELLERLLKIFLKEQREDEAIQEMKQFIEECDRAQEELNREHGLKLKKLMERLGNFSNVNEEVISKKGEAEVTDKKISDIRQAAREVVSR